MAAQTVTKRQADASDAKRNPGCGGVTGVSLRLRSTPRGSLERHLPQSAPTEQELFAMRRAAWRKQGIVVIRLDDVRDAWVRLALLNEATRLYGQPKDEPMPTPAQRRVKASR